MDGRHQPGISDHGLADPETHPAAVHPGLDRRRWFQHRLYDFLHLHDCHTLEFFIILFFTGAIDAIEKTFPKRFLQTWRSWVIDRHRRDCSKQGTSASKRGT